MKTKNLKILKTSQKIFALSLCLALSACNTETPAEVSAREKGFEIQRTYDQNEKFLLFSKPEQEKGQVFEDGKLWIVSKSAGSTGKAKLLDTRILGQQGFVQGAALSPKHDAVYAVVSIQEGQLQQDWLLKIGLPGLKTTLLGTTQDLGLSEVNGHTLKVSPEGSRLAFQGAVKQAKDVSSLDPHDPHFHPEGTENQDQYGIYELRVSGIAALSLQGHKNHLKLFLQEANPQKIPQYDLAGTLQAVLPSVAPETSHLNRQGYTHNLRFPVDEGSYQIARGYNTPSTHVGADAYALDINIAGPGDCGKKVFAATDGKVSLASYDARGYGNQVVLSHGNLNAKTLYAHLKETFVKLGDNITRGQAIGLIGTTGNSTGCHLHFVYRSAISNSPLKPATALKPMEGAGPFAPGSAASGSSGGQNSCPITGFEGASVNTYYRYSKC